MDQTIETAREEDQADQSDDTSTLLLNERDLQPRICMLPADGDGFDYPFQELEMYLRSSISVSESEPEKGSCRLSDDEFSSSLGDDEDNTFPPCTSRCKYCKGYCVHCINRRIPGQPMLDPGDFPLNIRHWIWAKVGWHDGLPWFLLCQLDDGKFAFYQASCCYTGCACARTQGRKISP
jgi:hypothetical protein